MREWNRAQRVAVVVAWGAALIVGWNCLETSPWNDYGWVNVAPNSGVVFNSSPLGNVWLRLAVQLLLVVVWLVPSVWLLAEPTRADPSDDA
jgi:hypothetical protein